MRPNPGGHLDPDEIVGRDEIVSEMWDILEGRSIYMNDLRRIGKTNILNKMIAECPEQWIAIFGDLEDIKKAGELSTWFYRNVMERLKIHKQAFRKMGDLLGAMSGVEIAGVLKLPDGSKAPWKETIYRTFDDLQEVMQKQNQKFVFCLDEVPYMLEGIISNESPATAMEVLDVIRKLAQSYKNVRFVLTGSIGLHHVLETLNLHGYNGSPLNNFSRMAPGPLDKESATYLARELIKGRPLKVSGDLDKVSEHIAQITGGVAFYIHRLLDRASRTVAHTAETIDRLLIEELTDPDEDWDLEHYIKRIGTTYYTGDGEREIVLGVLDIVAKSTSGISQSEILNTSKVTVGDVTDEKVREMLKLLLKDHYLTKDRNTYRFRMELVRRWWMMERGL